jgi:HlyD family secretion protein
MKKLLLILVMLAIVGGAAAWYFGRDTAQAAPLRTSKVVRDDLVATISATGTVEPEELIDVGAQVAGKILEFGKDLNGKSIDYGSEVKEGMLLARIDDSVYTAELASANAQLAEANAGVKRAEADLAQMKAKLAQAERDWQRAQQLGISDALAQVSYDAYRAAYESAVANIGVSDASILQAKANVDQAKSTLERAERNLGYTKIFSPVDGKIIDRRVNIGQTVVASLNAPSLFLIARDLRRMQVWVAVNEADVGHIHPGQAVTFTSDAFPGETFRGQVNKVRLNAQMTQNVVTYTVEVTTDNSSGKLLPYLTANVQFEVNRVDDTMMVPNAALRWNPKPDLIAPDARQSQTQPSGSNGSNAMASAEMDRGPARTASAGGPGAGAPGGGRRRRPPSGASGGDVARQEGAMRPETVWVKDGNYVRPVAVMAGLTDGTNTQVVSDQLKEGAEVVTGEIIAFNAGTNQQTNPFAPPSMRGGPRGQGGGRGGAGGGGSGGGGGGRGGR